MFGRALLAAVVLSCLLCSLGSMANEQEDEPEFTADFRLEECTFQTTGENAYFILKPGYQLVLEGEEDGEDVRVEITVLDETEDILLPEIGLVETRVVEEREYVEGNEEDEEDDNEEDEEDDVEEEEEKDEDDEDFEIVEVSRNFFAICNETGAVYYFGEDVDIYEDGEVVSHEGAWRAGQVGAKPGLMMPGSFLLGSRYFQEQAPGAAMDQAEHVDMGLTVATEAATFNDCVKVKETSSLNPDEIGYKVYCPGVGLIQDEELELVEYGEA